MKCIWAAAPQRSATQEQPPSLWKPLVWIVEELL